MRTIVPEHGDVRFPLHIKDTLGWEHTSLNWGTIIRGQLDLTRLRTI